MPSKAWRKVFLFHRNFGENVRGRTGVCVCEKGAAKTRETESQKCINRSSRQSNREHDVASLKFSTFFPHPLPPPPPECEIFFATIDLRLCKVPSLEDKISSRDQPTETRGGRRFERDQPGCVRKFVFARSCRRNFKVNAGTTKVVKTNNLQTFF